MSKSNKQVVGKVVKLEDCPFTIQVDNKKPWNNQILYNGVPITFVSKAVLTLDADENINRLDLTILGAKVEVVE